MTIADDDDNVVVVAAAAAATAGGAGAGAAGGGIEWLEADATTARVDLASTFVARVAFDADLGLVDGVGDGDSSRCRSFSSLIELDNMIPDAERDFEGEKNNNNNAKSHHITSKTKRGKTHKSITTNLLCNQRLKIEYFCRRHTCHNCI